MSIRKGWLLIGLVLLLGACEGGEVVNETSTSTTVSLSTTTSTPMVSTSTTSTSLAPSFEPALLPLAAKWVIASDHGILLVLSGDDALAAQLWDQPTAVAYMVGDELVAAQGSTVSDSYPRLAEGPIVVFDSSGSRPLPMIEERLVLFDADVVNGLPVAVATSTTGSTPDDTDERLLLIDLVTGERTDLGSVGGWESGVAQARLTDHGVVLLTEGEGVQRVVVRSLTGTDVWALAPDADASLAVTVKDTEMILLNPGFTDPDFTPTVTMVRYELADGSRLGTSTLTLKLSDNVRIEGGFCFTAEWAMDALICDQTYGGPLLISVSGTVDHLGDSDQGVVTVPRVGS